MEEFMRIPKFMLTSSGYWPRANIRYPWIYNCHLFVTTYVLSYLYIFTLTYDLYVNIDNPGILVSASYYYITIFVYNVKFLLFTLKRKRFISVLNDLKNPLFKSKNPNHKVFAESWLLLVHRYSFVYNFCCYTCWVMYTFIPLFDMKHGIRLPVRGWFPYNPKYSNLVFILTFIFQSLGQLCAITNNASMDLLPSIFMNIACAQIDMLKDNITNAIHYAESKSEEVQIKNNNCLTFVPLSEKEENILKDVLRDCVKHHTFILSFLHEVNSIFSIILFTQIVASGFIICITGLQLILMNNSKFETVNVAIYLFDILFQFSLYCWNGHHVIVQTSSIGDNCYYMDWYRCSTKIKKILFIIIERCRKPTKLNADYFFVLSIETMTSVLRNSYSYFAVLRSIYGE